ncbi:hypothetical protein FRB94_000918 [Tulasnella sp. JGI-2019a]|nr:hypothetical protein FRB93_002634 [Tulasnella sp. JGI-2019a]KAG9006223.1 hypothetical protein FRB94_000918 [Tulasnella sp. JGI-2019a]KAG9033311.1 hypothetical protein FRB95_000318 [Tulasnella sp. JGI-2019a]
MTQARVLPTKTIKLGEGKNITLLLYGFSAGLSDDSMAGSDEEEKQEIGPSKRKALLKSTGSRRRSVKSNHRDSSHHAPKTHPPDGGNTLRRLLGVDFDIPAFHKKGKGKTDVDLLSKVTLGPPDISREEGHNSSNSDVEEVEPRHPRESNVKTTPWAMKTPVEPQSGFSSIETTVGTKRHKPSDPESEDNSSILRPPVLPKKRRRGNRPAELSATESESDAGPSRLPPPPPRTLRVAAASNTRSDTESEGDDNVDRPWLIPINPLADPLRPKPAFKATTEQQLKSALILDHEQNIQVPRSLAMYLRPYQEEGVRFFWTRYKEGRGGILGDDMGLGKTIQVIAFLSAIMRKSGNMTDRGRRYDWVNEFLDTHRASELPAADANWPTCLIVGPKTVVGNWEREFETWGYFEVGLLTGTPAQRADVIKNFKMGRLDVLLTSHETARDNIDELEGLAFSVVIVDEAHKIKNDKTQTARAYNRFDCLVRFGLSGTMIQNSYKEIWPLLNWSNPGRVGTEKEWFQIIVRPMIEGQSKEANHQQLIDFRELARRFVERLLPAFFLRRTKDLIKDQLPTKIDKVVFCPLTKTQITVYQRFLDTEDAQLMITKDDKCDCGRKQKRGKCCYKTNSDGIHWKDLLLKYINILVKISNSLLLLYPGPGDTTAQIKRHRELMTVAFPRGDAGTYATALTNKQLCGKWDALSRLLEMWRENKDEKNKVLIFSKSVKLLDFLSMWLAAEGFNFRQLDGSVAQENRFQLIDAFNLDPDVFVFLISTMTGGTGLNLVAANKVVIFDPNWNPAHDLQAMDRAYRFGQVRDVSVYRLLGAGSLEELVYARQLYKQQQMRIGYDASHQTRLFAGVQGETEKQGELFGIKNILTLHTDLATKQQIEDAHLGNLEWALANTEAVADSDGLGEAKQMGTLLLDDEVPKLPSDSQSQSQAAAGEESIEELFNRAGIKYTHHNDHILRDNYIEAKIVEEAQKPKKRTGKAHSHNSRAGADRPAASWPPKRAHHRDIDEATARLQSRKEAIVAAGHDLAKFAEQFACMTPEQQAACLRELDAI